MRCPVGTWPRGSELLADAGLGLGALELRLEAVERLLGAAAPEQREHLALPGVLEPERGAAVHRERGEREPEAAGDPVQVDASADLVEPGQHLPTDRERQQQREERL